MKCAQIQRRYEPPQPSPKLQKKLELSMLEAQDLSLREIHCPRCQFLISRAYADAAGHLSVKCSKCKSVFILNLAYFRRQRGIARQRAAYYAENEAFLPCKIK